MQGSLAEERSLAGFGGDMQGGLSLQRRRRSGQQAGDAPREVAQRGLARQPVQPVRSQGGCWCPLRGREGAFLNGDALSSGRRVTRGF